MYMDEDKINSELVYIHKKKVYRDAPDDKIYKALSLVGTYPPIRPESDLT